MKPQLSKLSQGQTLTSDETTEAFEQIMTGQASPAQVGSLLAMIELRGATVDELVGAARVMRSKVAPIEVPAGMTVIDTCGTGGDHTPTFNISTTAALVAAAVGRPHGVGVAKHGNRTVTRTSGSSQGLEALGVKLDVTPDVLTRCLDETGFCFCFAPAHHPAMKHAMPVRLELGIRTMFNLLGPLTNPAGAGRQVMGVFKPELTEPIARVLQQLGAERAMVVHGYKSASRDQGGYCELSVNGPSQISELRDGQVSTLDIDPAALGLDVSPLDTLLVDGPESSARVIENVLAGDSGPARDIVMLNAAAALVVAGLADDLDNGLKSSADAIDTGAAREALATLIRITNDAS